MFAWFTFSKPEGRLDYWEGVSLIAIDGRRADALHRWPPTKPFAACRTSVSDFELALRAADAGAWEWSPPDRLTWDRSFAEIIGVDPASKEFLELIVHAAGLDPTTGRS